MFNIQVVSAKSNDIGEIFKVLSVNKNKTKTEFLIWDALGWRWIDSELCMFIDLKEENN